jgi:hypothetical protein
MKSARARVVCTLEAEISPGTYNKGFTGKDW